MWINNIFPECVAAEPTQLAYLLAKDYSTFEVELLLHDGIQADIYSISPILGMHADTYGYAHESGS